MPIYEWLCKECEQYFETYCNIGEVVESCKYCNSKNICKQMSVFTPRNFEPYKEENIDHEPVFVRNTMDLKDAIKRHNDGELASKVGKLSFDR